MMHLHDNAKHKHIHPKTDWVSVKEVAPVKIVENKWMLWASWGFTLFLPITIGLITIFKLFN